MAHSKYFSIRNIAIMLLLLVLSTSCAEKTEVFSAVIAPGTAALQVVATSEKSLSLEADVFLNRVTYVGTCKTKSDSTAEYGLHKATIHLADNIFFVDVAYIDEARIREHLSATGGLSSFEITLILYAPDMTQLYHIELAEWRNVTAQGDNYIDADRNIYIQPYKNDHKTPLSRWAISSTYHVIDFETLRAEIPIFQISDVTTAYTWQVEATYYGADSMLESRTILCNHPRPFHNAY